MKTAHLLRFLMLPLTKMDRVLPETGLIYEIGCGLGVISSYLGQKDSRQVVGIDMNQQKIAAAQQNNLLPNVSFIQAEATKFNYQKCSGAVLSDFLHHVDLATQEKILKKVNAALDKKGTMVIKEIDRNDGFRTWMSRWWDLIFYPKDKIYYRAKDDWRGFLIALGLQVEVVREVRWFPGSTYLFICQKK